jgi:replicative DNA helicase
MQSSGSPKFEWSEQRQRIERPHLMPDLRRALTNDLNLPVLLLADLPAPPSETPHSPPQLSDLRDYGRIDRIADLVLLLDRAGPMGRHRGQVRSELGRRQEPQRADETNRFALHRRDN